MVNFDDMAKAAKAKSQGIVDAAAEKARAEKEAEERRLADAGKALSDNVMPILQEAAAAFLNNGI